jgi:hypothetical protein
VTLTFLAFGVVILIMAIIVGRVTSDRTSGPVRPVADEMAILAMQAVEAARDAYDTNLDFAPDSVEHVEGILARLHQEHTTRPFFPERLAGEANRWGAYVGEVARRVKGGEWQRDSAHVGAGAYPLVWADQDEIYPCAWCFRRLTNGPEDNVWDKFRITVLNASSPV